MGVDIGICKYIPEREEQIAELNILQNLRGTKGQKAKEKLDEIYDSMYKEYKEILELKSPEIAQFLGQRMFNLWYNVDLHTIDLEFSFYNLYHNTRVTPDMLKDIVDDMEKLLPVSDMKERMEVLIKFFKDCIANNLMIYPT